MQTGLAKESSGGCEIGQNVLQELMGLVRSVCGSSGLITLSVGADRIGQVFCRSGQNWSKVSMGIGGIG